MQMHQQSRFFQGLQLEIRNVFSNQGLHYLFQEKWIQQVSQVYGWVHMLLHGADLLTERWCHPDFPINTEFMVFDILGQLFLKEWIRFTDDEDIGV